MRTSSRKVESELEAVAGTDSSGIASRINAIVASVRAWGETRLQARRTRRSLSALDDRLLDDIGLSREQVGHSSGELRGIADVVAWMIDPGDRP